MSKKSNITTTLFAPAIRTATVLLLMVSGLLTAMSANISSPRSTPDERHHYSYIKHVADNFWRFPPDLSAIYTASSNLKRPPDRNHLSHPPLYYYLMAVAYKTLEPDRQFPELIKELDVYGGVSSQAVIPALRAASLIFVILHLYGFYLLISFLIKERVIHQWLSVPIVLLTQFVPGFIYIGGSLNNDVLAMAIWPFLVLYACRYSIHSQSKDFWKSIIAIFAALLTKATLWMACLIIGLFVCYLFLKRAYLYRSNYRIFLSSALKTGHFGLPLMAFILISLSALHFGNNIILYNSLQPGTAQIYDIPKIELTSFKFEQNPELIPKTSLLEIIRGVLVGFRSLTGIMGHSDRIFRSNYEMLGYLFFTTLFLLSLIGLFHSRTLIISDIKIRILLLFIFTFLSFAILHIYKSYESFYRIAYFGTQGRYYIGYFELLVLGSVGIAFYSLRTLTRHNIISWLVSSLLLLCLFFILFNPLFYFRNSLEYYHRAEIPELIHATLKETNYRPLEYSSFWPSRQLAGRGYKKRSSDGLTDYYRFAWKNSTLAGSIEIDPKHCLSVKLWVRGDRAYSQDAQIGLGIVEAGSKPTRSDVQSIIEVSRKIEIKDAKLTVPAHIAKPTLFVRGLNSHSEQLANSPIHAIWPRMRLVYLLGVFYKATPC